MLRATFPTGGRLWAGGATPALRYGGTAGDREIAPAGETGGRRNAAPAVRGYCGRSGDRPYGGNGRAAQRRPCGTGVLRAIGRSPLRGETGGRRNAAPAGERAAHCRRTWTERASRQVPGRRPAAEGRAKRLAPDEVSVIPQENARAQTDCPGGHAVSVNAGAIRFLKNHIHPSNSASRSSNTTWCSVWFRISWRMPGYIFAVTRR